MRYVTGWYGFLAGWQNTWTDISYARFTEIRGISAVGQPSVGARQCLISLRSGLLSLISNLLVILSALARSAPGRM